MLRCKIENFENNENNDQSWQVLMRKANRKIFLVENVLLCADCETTARKPTELGHSQSPDIRDLLDVISFLLTQPVQQKPGVAGTGSLRKRSKRQGVLQLQHMIILLNLILLAPHPIQTT
jgi:hypothetical protein